MPPHGSPGPNCVQRDLKQLGVAIHCTDTIQYGTILQRILHLVTEWMSAAGDHGLKKRLQKLPYLPLLSHSFTNITLPPMVSKIAPGMTQVPSSTWINECKELYVAQLVACLHGVQEALGSISSTEESRHGGPCLWYQHLGGRGRKIKSSRLPSAT